MKFLLTYRLVTGSIANVELTVTGGVDNKISSRGLEAIRKHLREFHDLPEDSPIVVMNIIELSEFEPETINLTSDLPMPCSQSK